MAMPIIREIGVESALFSSNFAWSSCCRV